MVKFKFLAQFPVNHLSHPVISCFPLSLHQFASLAYNMIDRFVSITTSHTFAILLSLIYFRFKIVGSNDVVM